MNNKTFGSQARAELDRISQHINACCSCATCEAHYPVNTLHDLVGLIEQIDGHSPVRRRLMGAVLSGLNIDSLSTGEPTPPGAVLRESMKALGITVDQLADRTGYSRKQIILIRTERRLPSKEVALALERAGVGKAEMWNRMTSEYKIWLLRQKENT